MALRVTLIGGAIIAGIVVLMIVGSALGVFGNFLGIGDRVTDTDRMVATYEDFYSKCATYNTLTRQERNLQRRLDNAGDDDRSRVQSQVVGVQGQRARVVEEYDSQAAQRTTSWLRDNDLPERLAPHLDAQELASCE